MALAILTAPSDLSSVSNEMLFILEESTKTADPITYPNYHFILDVYVDSILVGRMRVPPDPEHSYGIFDVSTILRDYVPEYRLKANYSNATETYDIHVNYRVKAGEEYDGTIYTNIVVDSSDRSGFKSYAKRPLLTTDLITAKTGFIFSSRPFGAGKFTVDHKANKWNIIPYYNNVSGITISWNFDDGEGNIVGSGSTFSYNDPGEVKQINFGFQKLAASLTTAQKSQVARLVFDVDDGMSSIEYVIKYYCTKFTPIILAWVNPLGAYESQSFGLVSKKTNQITRKEFAQLPYRIATEGIISYDVNGTMYGGKRGFAAHTKTTMSLTSHLLSDDEYTWLSELFSSPDVYRYDPDMDRFVPCMISDTNYDYRTFRNSKLTPLQFTIQFADEYNSQYL